jgi:hypothetical protein
MADSLLPTGQRTCFSLTGTGLSKVYIYIYIYIFFFFEFYECMCLEMCVSAGACGGQKRASDPQGQELQVIVS